jgi:fermentation-respiration switch protein FrsA (DUF1100 family)
MHDQFRSDERIAQVTAPLLVLHGGRDVVVPIRFGERLFALAHEPKRFVRPAGITISTNLARARRPGASSRKGRGSE